MTRECLLLYRFPLPTRTPVFPSQRRQGEQSARTSPEEAEGASRGRRRRAGEGQSTFFTAEVLRQPPNGGHSQRRWRKRAWRREQAWGGLLRQAEWKGKKQGVKRWCRGCLTDFSFHPSIFKACQRNTYFYTYKMIHIDFCVYKNWLDSQWFFNLQSAYQRSSNSTFTCLIHASYLFQLTESAITINIC